jgi:hypothetical protein
MNALSRLAPLALLLLLAATALAGGPDRERIAGHEAFAKGRLDGLSLDAEGVLRPGFAMKALPLEADTAWCAARSEKALWIGLGNEPAVFLVLPDGGKRIALGEGLMVTALAPLPGDAVAAAVFPGGRIVRVARDGAVSPLAKLPAEHVWALASSATGVLTAGCGVPGALFRVDPFGAVTKLADVEDAHARCLATGTDGTTLYVGTAPKGRVLAFDGKALSVVRDLEPQEVVGIVAREDGGLIVAANADQAGGNAQQMANLLRQLAEPRETKNGEKPAERAALQDGSLLFIEPTGVVTTLWEQKKTAVLGLAPDGAGAVAGTYPSARVVRVEPGKPHALIADLPEAEASVVISDRGTFLGVATSNPAVLHGREPDADKGTWTSAPVDAGAPSRWGRVTLWGTGVRTLRYRSGPTSEPDASWTAWASLAGFDGEAGAMDATARFVQVEATLEGASAELRSVELVRRTPNRAPALSELKAEKPAPKKGEAPGADPKIEIAWKAEDEDGDRLRTTVAVNRKGSPHWTTLVDAEELDKPKHTWDTTGMPDGVYQVRVTVSDAPDNEPERARETSAVLTGVRVDNTPPTVQLTARRYGGGRLQIEGIAQDANDGRVLQVRVSLDGGPWIPLAAKDGLYDSGREPFEGLLRVPEAGAHDVVVQVTDADGNVAAAAVVVR